MLVHGIQYLLFKGTSMVFGENSIVVRGIKKLYPRFGLLPTDIIFGTFPKSGTTWVRFIFANIISLAELDGREVDYDFLNGESWMRVMIATNIQGSDIL